MNVISCNISQKHTFLRNGKEIETGINKYAVESGINLGFTDVQNDHVIDRRFHGGIEKACYLYGRAQYEYWQSKYPNLDWHFGMLGENITLDKLDESTIKTGSIYKIGTALVQITKPRQPCFKLAWILGGNDRLKAFWNAPYPGIYVKVLELGHVTVGDQMILVEENKTGDSILEMYHKKRAKKLQ